MELDLNERADSNIKGKSNAEKRRDMEWLSTLKKAIDYMEGHLLDNITAADVAESVHVSPFYFQRGFKIVTGYSVGEYLRNRRLYLAGLDAIRSEEKIIDLSYRYGYDAPESFTRAFARFHGVSPMQLKAQPFRIRVFLPLTIEIAIKGGTKMEYVVEKMDDMKMIGIEKVILNSRGFQDAPRFWDEFQKRYCKPGAAEKEVRQAVIDNEVGEFGICFEDDVNGESFRYVIAGLYRGGNVPEGMKIFEIPQYEWVKFQCTGPMPEALQTVNTRIYKEWLPGNPQYEIAASVNMEWYSKGDIQSSDYESGIWIPVKRRTTEKG